MGKLKLIIKARASMKMRRVGSIKYELLAKAREAMLCAIQIYNNPIIVFKSENFIVLSIIAWTYMLHAYYKSKNIEYRYYSMNGKRKKFDRTKAGAYKFWELERCLNDPNCPIDPISTKNLKFLIGIRHEIEHQMTTRIDDYISAKFQSCCINFNHYLKTLFNDIQGIDDYLSVSLQFSSISEPQAKTINDYSFLPKNISSYIDDFDNSMTEEEFNDPKFSYRVLYVQKVVNKKGQADKVIEFLPADSPEAVGINKNLVYIRDREKPKYIPSEIVNLMHNKGYPNFKIHHHTNIWKEKDGKNPSKGYGVIISNNWYWYESWLSIVEEYCINNKDRFT